jgi:hypothetical protein
MARIITVYSTESRATRLVDMSYIRWFRMSAALARLGHEVDIATAEFKWRLRKPVVPMMPGLRRVPISRVRWSDYDVVKTLFHRGWETLEEHGGARHPFIIAKLGSVVGAHDMPGIYFYGRQREGMFAVQSRIAAGARYVTVLSEPAGDLWRASHPGPAPLLLVPGAVDAEIPEPGDDPFPRPRSAGVRCLFAGTFYSSDARSQPEAHRTIVSKLNELGARLRSGGAHLYVLGDGDPRQLDTDTVTWVGSADYDASWNWLQHADVGVVVSAGRFMHNNESTKIYHYLRAGLPVVSESGFPNDHVVSESGLGFVSESGRVDLLAARAHEAAHHEWDRAAAVRYILQHHTWDVRAAVYGEVLREHITPQPLAR